MNQKAILKMKKLDDITGHEIGKIIYQQITSDPMKTYLFWCIKNVILLEKACSPYIKELGDKPYRILLVERIHTKSNTRCWFTISQNLKLKFDDSEEPIPFNQDHGRDFCHGHYFENNWERAYEDYVKRIMQENSKESFPQ